MRQKVLRESSRNGTTSTKNPLTLAEIITLMESCRKHGVSFLTLGDLSVEFGLYTNGIDTPATPEQMAAASKVDAATLSSEVIDFRQRQLDEMALTDPLALENMIAQDLVEDITDAQNSTE